MEQENNMFIPILNIYEIICNHVVMVDLLDISNLTARSLTDGKWVPVTAINLQAAGGHKDARPHLSQRCVN